MTDDLSAKPVSLTRVFSYIAQILGPERDFYALAAVYGIGISLLSLALPISVQMLINTVANTALVAPLAVLSITLFVLLTISGLLYALRLHLMEIFGRRFYARMVSEISLRAVYAANPFFHDASKGPLFNRYFDIMVIQKSVPHLIIGGFTLVLQALVGFVLVSLYHPLFLAFNIVFILLIWIVLAMWGPGAIRSAIDLSHKKHAASAWLEGVAASNGYFKSERHIAHALTNTDAVTSDYVEEHRRHFRQHFSQTILLLLIYAAASAILLGLGGWLVIQGQLTLGQLVAAELILSAVFAGVAQLGTYLTSFYDLCAAIDELSLFYEVPQEEPKGEFRSPLEDATLTFTNVRGNARGQKAIFNFTIPGGATVKAAVSDHGLQRLFSHLLRRHVDSEAGFISVGGGDILAADIHALRQQIIIIDRPTIIEMTIREYLQLNCEDASPERIMSVLRLVGLEEAISSLGNGLDTELATTGWPLSITEAIQLKLAGALLSRPRILVLNQLIDLIPAHHLRRVVNAVKENENLTLVYFTHRREDFGYDGYLYMTHDAQTLYTSHDPFEALVYPHGAQAQLAPPSAGAEPNA